MNSKYCGSMCRDGFPYKVPGKLNLEGTEIHYMKCWGKTIVGTVNTVYKSACEIYLWFIEIILKGEMLGKGLSIKKK